MNSMASNVVRVISAVVENSKNEINGKILTRPALLVTDGDSRTYCVDVDIGIDSEAETLKNVPLARASRDLLYADVGNACRLRRTASGQWEVVGYSKELPGTYKRFAVNLTDFSFGPVEDRSISGRLLTYEELGIYGTYGSIPYGATVIFKGDVATNLGGAPRQGTTPLPVPVPVPPPPSPPSGEYGTAWKPFSADSPWNTPIPANATYASASDIRVSRFRSHSSPLNIAGDWYTQWVWFAEETDPLVTINVSTHNLDGNSTDSYWGSRPRDGDVTIRMPAGAHPDPGRSDGVHGTYWTDFPEGKDAHITIIDPDRLHSHEFWHAEEDAEGKKAVAYVKVPLTGLGVNICGERTEQLVGEYFNSAFVNLGWAAARAYGGSSLGGLIRAEELTVGPMNHALALLLPFELLGNSPNNIPQWPATRTEFHSSYGGTTILGTRFAIPRSVDIDSLGLSSAAARVFATTLQEYGAYVVDSAGSINFNADGVAAYADSQAVSGADLVKIKAVMTIVNS
jgi:hypothetical protein